MLSGAHFDHCLREIIRDFCQTLTDLAKSDLEYYRRFAMDVTMTCQQTFVHCELRQASVTSIVNKLGDKAKKIQCHAINTLVKIVSHAQRNFDTETPLLVLSELLVFLSRPGTKPSHRIYCMGFLNKFATMDASSETAVRAQLLRIYFGLFNKLLHTGEKFDMEAEQKKLKKDRTMGKKERIKALRKLSSQSRETLNEEDNKVVELVLKGINLVMTKTEDIKAIHSILEEQIDILFKLTHHKVLRI